VSRLIRPLNRSIPGIAWDRGTILPEKLA